MTHIPYQVDISDSGFSDFFIWQKTLRHRQILTAVLSEKHAPIQKENWKIRRCWRCPNSIYLPSRVCHCSIICSTLFPDSPQKCHSFCLSRSHTQSFLHYYMPQKCCWSRECQIFSNMHSEWSVPAAAPIAHPCVQTQLTPWPACQMQASQARSPCSPIALSFLCARYVRAIPSCLYHAHIKAADMIFQQASLTNFITLLTGSKPRYFTPFFHSR